MLNSPPPQKKVLEAPDKHTFKKLESFYYQHYHSVPVCILLTSLVHLPHLGHCLYIKDHASSAQKNC